MTKEILPINSRYNVCYTLEELNDTINELLDVLDANDMLRELKNIFEHCSHKFDNINIALKQSILPNTSVEIKGHVHEDTLDAIYEGAGCEGLEMDIDNLEEKILRDNRSVKTLDVFFLLCDIPEVKDIETNWL